MEGVPRAGGVKSFGGSSSGEEHGEVVDQRPKASGIVDLGGKCELC